MNITFEAVTSNSVTVLLEMLSALYLEDGERPMPPGFSRRAAESLIAQPLFGGVWFVVLNGERVGYLVVTFSFSFEYGGRDGLVDELWIAPNQRGRGIGSHALAFAEEYCRQQGVVAIHLEAYGENDAMRLYTRAGYRPHDSTYFTKWLTPDGNPPNA